MFKNNKVIISAILIAPMLLTGCNNEANEEIENIEEIEHVEEWIVSEEEESKEDISSEENDRKEDNKEEDSKDKVDSSSNDLNTESPSKDKVEENSKDSITLLENPVFKKEEISQNIKSRMIGKSMPNDSTVGFEDLSYLTITYLGYDGKSKTGEMVVHKNLADEVLDIFKEIYNSKFPIEKMNLIDNYDASDHSSMVDNNTSAFCYRTISGTNKVSNHGKGMAIDINPFYNPHVLKSSGKVNPPESSKYVNRNLSAKGMIKYNDVVYKAFTSRGWKWGGNWNNPDYQHFEKQI